MTCSRDDVVRVARSYLRTPFGHRGRQPGLVLDCAGVPICIARELGLVEPTFDVPEYEVNPNGDSMLTWCDQYMTKAEGRGTVGDVLVVAIQEDPQHLCILVPYRHGGLGVIHAASKRWGRELRGSVIESRLMFSTAMKFIAAYTMPGVV